jgi:Tol biopolymer transport system component
MRNWWRAVVIMLGGCGGLEAPDAPPDAPPEVRCDPSQPFGEVIPVPGVNTDEWDGNPALSPDELTMYFASIRQSPGTANGDLYVATRSSRDEAFGPAAAMTALNTGSDERGVSVTPDGLTLYFHSSRSAYYDLWLSARANTAAPFDAPVALAALNTSDVETSPMIAANGQTLYFERTPPEGSTAIWKSTLGGTGFAAPTMVTELNSASAFNPLISGDGLQMYFASDRPPSLGTDIWVASRASAEDPFGTPTNVAELNTNANDRPGWISPDGCRMYFWSSRSGGSGSFDIWQATRPQ